MMTAAEPPRSSGFRARLLAVVARFDHWQRGNRIVGPAYAVVKKFGDDDANLYVVALGWYGFTAIYPLILVVVTIFGFIGVSSLGDNVVGTLRQFPVIGQQFRPGPGGSNLHGNVLALVVGLAALVYGAQGVTQIAQQAMARAWNQPRVERPGFGARLGRSLGGLAAIAGSFFVNAFAASVAAGVGRSVAVRVAIVVALLAVNVGGYLLAFFVLTPVAVRPRELLPGAVGAAIGFTLLITVGAGLVQHQLRHSSATYGALGAVIGVVAFLLLLAKLSMYAMELNPVLAQGLWPRALPTTPPTDADTRALRKLTQETRMRTDERIGVGFGADAARDAADDARRTIPTDPATGDRSGT